MRHPVLRVSCLITFALLLHACGGGGSVTIGGDPDNASTSSSVSIGFSDAPVEDAAKVVITVDAITFNRPGDAEDIRVERFTSEALGLTDADTFQIDLLQVQGNDNLLVIDSVDLPVGDYNNLRISVIDEDINFSFVEAESDGQLKPIKVPSDELKLGGFEVTDSTTQTFIVEFSLRQALAFNPGPDRYILKPRGVRVVALTEAASIQGTVDFDELALSPACMAKPDPAANNAVFLYSGTGLDVSNLADNFVSEANADTDEAFDPAAPADAIAPFDSAAVGTDGTYLFSFVPPGDYTLALSCLAEGDDPVLFDTLTIPAPESALVELTLPAGNQAVCPFPLPEEGCTLTP